MKQNLITFLCLSKSNGLHKKRFILSVTLLFDHLIEDYWLRSTFVSVDSSQITIAAINMTRWKKITRVEIHKMSVLYNVIKPKLYIPFICRRSFDVVIQCIRHTKSPKYHFVSRSGFTMLPNNWFYVTVCVS